MTPLPETPPDAATSLSALMVQPSEQAPLTPAQQRFNDLLARIEALSGLIQRLEAWSDRHRYTHIQALRESVQLAQTHRKSLLLFVHERLQTADLTDRQQRMARGMVRGLIDHLAPMADPQVQALANCLNTVRMVLFASASRNMAGGTSPFSAAALFFWACFCAFLAARLAALRCSSASCWRCHWRMPACIISSGVWYWPAFSIGWPSASSMRSRSL